MTFNVHYTIYVFRVSFDFLLSCYWTSWTIAFLPSPMFFPTHQAERTLVIPVIRDSHASQLSSSTTGSSDHHSTAVKGDYKKHESRHRNDSPVATKLNRSAFQRNSAVRRSLGGTAPPAAAAAARGDELQPKQQHYQTMPCSGSGAWNKLTIRVVNLPSLDELGYSLDSYSDPDTGLVSSLLSSSASKSPLFSPSPFVNGVLLETLV